MLKHLFLLILGSTASVLAFGQSTQSGVVFESKTRLVLQGIKVENLVSHKIIITGKDGTFSIAGKTGEILVFSGGFYRADTLLLTGNKPLEIFLVPQHNMLNEVNVTATEATHTGSFQSPEFHNQTVVYQRDANGYYKGGVALRLHYFKKDEKRKAKQAAFLQDQAKQDEIAKVFNSANISKYLPLKGKDMDDFLILYTPSTKDYYSSAFNLAAYLDTSYKAFLKIPADKRNTELGATPPVLGKQ
ncbi:hypothetical protein [Mucilaginibacter sp. FT3.2]|uniref:hypothetical protein n=1 Tax=Mucilaginibacter sp. FT3.2 TaxID=2723090 RepID=UPI0016133B88|nr:hypothetical protein [Mucilaginibacter sp. FT3.2]MBB6231662.1 hypothetical protein [Mucilaginibacter sp. FT3.2]